MNFLPIAASDMDVIIGIIAVIGWIVAQVLGKMKGNDKAPPPDSTATPTDPQDELRKFFEEMEKNLNPRPEPKPAPPPLPPPPKPKPAVVRREHTVPTPAPASLEVREHTTVAESPVQTAEEAARVFMRAVERAAIVPVVPAPPPCCLVPEGLRDPKALRKMIVTMEVLGKPVALKAS